MVTALENNVSAQKTITIVSITGHQPYAQGSVYAIERSYRELQKKFPREKLKCLLVSPQAPQHLANYIEHLPCQPFSYLEYNLFVLYLLDDLIDTDFALIVQNDGFVVDGNNWQEEFLDYDYIGAPLLHIFEKMPDGSIKEYINEECTPYLKQPQENVFIGQNGGFSLRSKRLLGLPRQLRIKSAFSIPKPLNKHEKLCLQYNSVGHNEDVILTLLQRSTLEEQGVRFAPLKVASYFASETTLIQREQNIPFSEVFGCHTFGFLVLTGENQLYMPKKVTFSDNNIANNELCRWLLQAGFAIEVPKAFLSSTPNTTK